MIPVRYMIVNSPCGIMPRMFPCGGRVRGLAAIVVFASIVFISACTRPNNGNLTLFQASATPTATQTATQTSTPTPIPTQIPTATPHPEVRIESADQALFNGDWARAEVEYAQALAEAEIPEQAAAAQLGLGTTKLRSGDIEGSIGDFNLFLQAYPSDVNIPDAHFLLADAYLVQGIWGLAIENYQRYLALQPGLIDSYVYERMGIAHRENQAPADAARAFELAIVAERAGNLNFLLLDKAAALLQAGDPLGALALYDLVDINTQHASTRAEMDLRRGRVYLELGDIENAYAQFLHSVETYPESYNSYSAMLALLDAEFEIDELQQGIIFFHAGEYVASIESFDRHLIAEPEHTGEPHYLKALAYRSLGNYGTAQTEFREIIDTHPGDSLWETAWTELALTQWAWGNDLASAIRTYESFAEFAPEHSDTPNILFQAGRLYERTFNLSRAAETWANVADVFPFSSEAPEAALMAGISFYRQSLYSLALERFEQAAAFEQADLELRSAAHLWIGKTSQLLEQDEQASQAFQAAIATDPRGYYALRAADLAAGFDEPRIAPTYSFEFDEVAERAEAEAWLAAQLQLKSTSSLGVMSPALAADGRWIRGSNLWQLGLAEEAKSELDSLWRDMRGDALSEYQLAIALRDLGYYYGAIWSARSTLDALGLSDPLSAPVYFSHLRYGPYYADLIIPGAELYSLDPLLVYALVRQESLFQGAVISFSFAQGLMQIIPDTGSWIALQLEWPNYENDDLYRPYINVPFGTFYLAQQRDYLDGHIFAALAAYNAGPGNSEIWYAASDGDDDLFVELIRLDEPQRSVRRVYEHYAVYRDLYGG